MKTRIVLDIEHGDTDNDMTWLQGLVAGLEDEMHQIAKSQRAYGHEVNLLNIVTHDIPNKETI